MTEPLVFPEGFLWGAATSSYQIEGAVREDGRAESIWDRFSHTPGKTHNGDTGDVACDHYHLYRQDVALMAELGLRAYRFSVAWPRVIPDGSGSVNEAGLDFYDRLVDELLAAGVRPFVTLYHWDLPQALHEAGGWADRQCAAHFGRYAEVVVRRLGDRVKDWITLNEPFVAAWLGYEKGIHAPGITDRGTCLRVTHNFLLAHAAGVEAVRAEAPDARVGIAPNLVPAQPASDSEEDREAARLFDGYVNRWFLDPVFKGSYPADMLHYYGALAPRPEPGDMERIRAPLDFLGINYYSRAVIERDRSPSPRNYWKSIAHGSQDVTWTGSEIYPEGLYELLLRVHREYGEPRVYVTENGAVYDDAIGPNGEVEDPGRVDFYTRHFEKAHRAIRDGARLEGYFVWSLLDNFEWADGYSKRFGIVYTDYPTQRRVPKSSARWYAGVIERNGLSSASTQEAVR